VSTHTCPGGCGAKVATELYACNRCWWRLPTRLRARIRMSRSAADMGARSEAMREARAWYKANAA